MHPIRNILIVAIGMTLASCAGPTVLKDDEGVKIIQGPTNALNIHGYGDTIIEIKGIKYHHVWTGNAYYVRLPDRNAVLFVTSTGGAGTNTTKIHVVDLDTGRHIETKRSDIWFGTALGNPKENASSDYVESSQASFLILVSKSPSFFYRYKMDLKNGALEKLP